MSVLLPTAQPEPTWRPWLAAVLSLVGHVLAVTGVMALSAYLAAHAPKKPKARPVAMRTISSAEWSKNRGASAPPLDEKPVPMPKGQIVDVAPGNNKIDPNAKYLAETNNRVAKETRAREQSQKWSTAAPKNSAKPEVMPSAQGRTGGKQQEAASAASLAERRPFGFGSYAPPSLLPKEAQHGTEQDNTPGSQGEGGQHVGDGTQVSNSDTATTSAVGGAAPNDNLSGVEAGDGTYLNTREFKFAGFFNRVKQAVSAKWDPNGRLRSKDPRGDKSLIDRTTVMAVALRPDGSIADLFVAKSSGVDYLDQEAMQAFEKAQPFPNPPPQLVVDGYIRFQFSFTISPNMGGLPRMFGFQR